MRRILTLSERFSHPNFAVDKLVKEFVYSQSTFIMNPEVREHLIRYVDGEIQQAEAAAADSGNAVRQTAGNSYIKEDARPVWEAQIISSQKNGRLKSLRVCREELEQAGPMDTVGQGAQLRLLLDDGEMEGLVMDTRVGLPDIQELTPKSPIIQAIWGAGVGFSATYQAPAGPKQVKILEIH